jgi:hypothetical protein
MGFCMFQLKWIRLSLNISNRFAQNKSLNADLFWLRSALNIKLS